MPNRTIALIIALTISVVALLFIASSPWRAPSPTQPPVVKASPTPNQAFTVFSLSPNPVVVSGSKPTDVAVMIDTGINVVDTVQFELVYDPSVVTNVTVTPGTFLPNPAVLLNKVDQQKGTINLAYGISPGDKGKSGTGTIATVTFTAIAQPGKTTPVSFNQSTTRTLATQQGITTSVLKSTAGTTIIVRPTGSALQGTGSTDGSSFPTIPAQ